jgi:Asp-tRNA(Asn)/Glu-tRNA(Gln) amidotransferase B subunit
MEIVSEPDMRSVLKSRQRLDLVKGCCLFVSRSPEEAGEYVRTLQAMLRAVGASDGSMELVSTSSRAFFPV